MYHIKKDQRSRRSAVAIYDALVTLIGEQSFDSIKVSELVEQAQVGRATFYRNFDVIEDVLRWKCDQVVVELLRYIVEYRRSQQGSAFLSVLKPVLRFFYLHSGVVELLLAAKRIDILQQALQTKVEATQPALALNDIPSEYLAYMPVIRSTVAVQILAHWVQGGKKEAPDELADGLTHMIRQMHGLGALL